MKQPSLFCLLDDDVMININIVSNKKIFFDEAAGTCHYLILDLNMWPIIGGGQVPCSYAFIMLPDLCS